MKKSPLYVALFGSTLSAAAVAGPQTVSFDLLWTHSHEAAGQVSEIPAFDPLTNTLWVAGVVGVDVLDAATGALVQHIDVTSHGFVNSVDIHDGLAAFAVEAFSRAPSSPPVPEDGDRRNPGKVLLYDTATRAPSSGVNQITVGSLPDMLTFSHDGSRLLVANEGTPNQSADQPYQLGIDPATGINRDPPGTVSVIDMETRMLLTNAGLPVWIPTSGTRLRPASLAGVGMDYEPEYIAVGPTGQTAYVTLQEGNAIGVLDLHANVFTQIIGLGAKSFTAPGPQLDPCDNCGAPNAGITFINAAVNGLYMPDSIAAYLWRGNTYLVMANEGDYREDSVDQVARASTLGATPPLARLRVSGPDSVAGNPPTLYAAGARSFSIRDTDGNLIYDSGDILDKAAASANPNVYDDGRSDDKGMEPEGVALIEIRGETYAFIGLERTLQSAVAAFNITNPNSVEYLGLIVTPGGDAPEGLDAYQHNGRYYLAISHEDSNTTTVYEIDTVNPAGK
jgi:DNA-binding beta-propeller fold protein YncE